MAQVLSAFTLSLTVIFMGASLWLASPFSSSSSSCLSPSSSSTSSCSLSSSTRSAWQTTCAAPLQKRVRTPWTPSHLPQTMTLRKHDFKNNPKEQHVLNFQVVHWIMQLTMLIALRCRLHLCSSPDQKTCFQEHPTPSQTLNTPNAPHPPATQHLTQHPTTAQQPNTRPSTQHRTTEPPNTPTPDPTAQHPNNPSCGKPHPMEGKEGSTTEKKREKRNSTQRRRPGSTAQQKTREKAARPSTPPKGGAVKAAPPCWNVDLTRTPNRCKGTAIRPAWNVEVVPKRKYFRFRPARTFACSTRRDDALSAGPPGKRFSMDQQQQQTVTCATTCGSGQGNGTFDSCRKLGEIFQNCEETQQISKIQFRIPKPLHRKSIFELSREVPLWFSSSCFYFLFFSFFFSFFSFLLMFSLFSSLFSFSQRNRKISETWHVKTFITLIHVTI